MGRSLQRSNVQFRVSSGETDGIPVPGPWERIASERPETSLFRPFAFLPPTFIMLRYRTSYSLGQIIRVLWHEKNARYEQGRGTGRVMIPFLTPDVAQILVCVYIRNYM